MIASRMWWHNSSLMNGDDKARIGMMQVAHHAARQRTFRTRGSRAGTRAERSEERRLPPPAYIWGIATMHTQPLLPPGTSSVKKDNSVGLGQRYAWPLRNGVFFRCNMREP